MPRLIGISGKAESGKDLVAAFITAVYPRGYYRRAFADALKVEALLAWARQQDNPVLLAIAAHGTLEQKLAAANLLKSGNESFRTVLQNHGATQREADPYHWIDRLFADHRLHPRYGLLEMVVPDVRYKNEASAIEDRGGLVLRLERPGYQNRLTPEQRAHSSECDLDDWQEGPNYHIIENDGDPARLLQKVLAEVDAFNGYRR